MRRLALAAGLAAALGLACGGDGGPAAPAAAPIAVPAGVWSWVDIPDSACDDGSPTGLGVNPGSGPDLLVFLDGGGACWDYLTCYVLNTASRGPFGAAELARREVSAAGSVLDRALPGNPYADATLVFVPYCTGDVHGGDRVTTYDDGLGHARAYHHVGQANLRAYLARLAATWPAPRRVILAGSSAGGFGAVLGYDAVRRTWPDAQGVLVDDSGPPLEAGAIPQARLDAWFARWGLGDVLDPLCGQACRTDLSAGLTALSARYPADRLALLSSLQDAVISAYLGILPGQLQTDLLALAADVFPRAPNARYFYVSGVSHTMLGRPASFAQGDTLLAWLGLQLAGDPAWASRRP